MRGIQGAFHSCTTTFLPFLINSLSDDKLPTSLLFKVLVQTVTDVLSCIHYTKNEVFWSTMLESIDSYIKIQDKFIGLEYVLKLIGQAVEYKQGKFLTQAHLLIGRLIKVINGPFSESVLMIVSQICVLILTSENITLSQESSSLITLNMLSIENPDILLNFVENSISYTQFEILILPKFLKYCEKTILNNKCLKILMEICFKKAPLSISGLQLNKWRRYPIDLKNDDIYKKVLELLSVNKLEDIYNNFDNIMCILICLPHMGYFVKEIKNSCKTIIKMVLNHLKPNPDAMEVDDEVNTTVSDIRRHLFILGMTLECAVHIVSDDVKDYLDINELVDIILPFCNSLEYVEALNVLDLALTASSIDLNTIDLNMFNKLHYVLVKNLSAPCHKVNICFRISKDNRLYKYLLIQILYRFA